MQKIYTLLDQLSLIEIKGGSRLSSLLDFLRAIAVIEVIAGHLRNLYFVDFNQIEIKNSLPVKTLYFVTGFAHQAVIIFFVLSGFLIGNSVLKNIKKNRFSWKSYLIARFSRLWIVLLPTLILGLIWDLTGNFLSRGESQVYLGTLGTNIITQPVSNKISLDVFFGNLFFLQGYYFPTLGSNTALWSLSKEFWYYITFPVIIILIFKLKNKYKFIIYLTILLVLLFGLGLRNDQGFLVWLFGSFISFFPNKLNISQRYQSFSLLASLSFLITIILAIRYNLINQYEDLILGLSVSILIIVMSFKRTDMKETIFSKIYIFLADFSYTIYLAHLPFLVFILSLLVKNKRWQPDPQHLFYGFLVFLITMCYCRLIYILTEKHTPKLRAYLDKTL